MILLFILITLLISMPVGYAFGRVHGINQSMKAMERYGKLAELSGGTPLEISPKKPAKGKSINKHYGCGGTWGKWKDSSIRIVKSDGSPTGRTVMGQVRHCDDCGVKEVRTDV